MSLDEEFRRLELVADAVEFRARVSRIPTSMMVEMRERLSARMDELSKKVAAIDHCAPRCRCGAISDGMCITCVAVDAKADEMLRYWKAHGAFGKWLAGEQMLPSDAAIFWKAWWDSRQWDHREGCLFPECEIEPHWESCTRHRWLISYGTRPKRNLARERHDGR